MTNDDKERLRNRALEMLGRGWSLDKVLHFVRERLPQTSRRDSDELERTINDIVERRRRWRLDDKQAVDQFIAAVL